VKTTTILRHVALVVALSSSLGSQTADTARVRAAYAAVTTLRNDYERSYGRFVAVNGIGMHYLEWGDKNGVPLVWAHGTRAVRMRFAPSHRDSRKRATECSRSTYAATASLE